MEKNKKNTTRFTQMFWGFFAFFVLPLTAITIGAKPVQADLLVSPLRVSFEGRDRQAVVTLINNSNSTNTYRVEWKMFRMGDDGKYKDIPEDDTSDFAMRARKMAELVRFSPRQVTIDPGGRQRVRLSLRRSEELQEGEYRAHLSFSKLPEAKEESADVEGIQFKLYVNLSFTIPVLYSHGDKNVEVEIESASFQPPSEENGQRHSLSVQLHRTGTHTSYGRLQAYWTPEGSSKEQKIGLINNVAIYSERDNRAMLMPLTTNAAIRGGRVRVVYEGDAEFKGRVWDEKTFPVVN